MNNELHIFAAQDCTRSNVANCSFPIVRSQFAVPNCSRRRGFTLIELMVSTTIMLMLGIIIIGFLRGALGISRTGAARGQAYETAQTVMRDMANDLAQVVAAPAHPDGQDDDCAFLVMQDPFGRQMLAFTRAWGEEQRSTAGYDAGRGSSQQGYSQDFSGRNVTDAIRPSHGNLEVVYLMEPTPEGTRLYRAERSPPSAGGLIDQMAAWCADYQGQGDIVPLGALQNARIGGEPLWDQFHLVADNVVAFGVELWDDWNRTMSWYSGPAGPVVTWSMGQRRAEGKPPQYQLPRALRLTLIIGQEPPLTAETTLDAELPAADNSVYVGDTDAFNDPGSGAGFIRIDGEVIAYGSRSGRTFGSCARGELGTRASAHKPGAMVMGGEVFRRVIQLPVAR